MNMTVVNVSPLSDKVSELLKADTDVRKYSTRVETGAYNSKSIRGIEVHIVADMAVEKDTPRILYGQIYTVPVRIDCVCRFREVEKLQSDLTELIMYIRDVIEDNYTLGGIANKYTRPIESEAEYVPEENPEVYVYSLIINYEVIKAR